MVCPKISDSGRHQRTLLAGERRILAGGYRKQWIVFRTGNGGKAAGERLASGVWSLDTYFGARQGAESGTDR